MLDPSFLGFAGQGIAGMILFALAGGLSVVFFFPGSVLMTAAGAAFGLTRGFLTAQAGATLGAGLAFLVSRYLARRRVERWVFSKPAFAAVDEAIGAMVSGSSFSPDAVRSSPTSSRTMPSVSPA